MIAVFDIGNSYTKLILFSKKEKIIVKKKYSTLNIDKEKIFILFSKYKINYIVIGSVVKNIDKIIIDIGKKLFIKVFLIKKDLFWKKNFQIKCSKKEIGLDILSSSYLLSKDNRSFLLVSFGTLTFASFFFDKTVQGVCIAPNFNLNEFKEFSNVSLINKIKVNLNESMLFGIDTNSAISSGIKHYYFGFIKSLIDATRTFTKEINIYICGGNSNIFMKIKNDFNLIIDEDIVIKSYFFIFKEIKMGIYY